MYGSDRFVCVCEREGVMCVCVCVCVSERERVPERQTDRQKRTIYLSVRIHW